MSKYNTVGKIHILLFLYLLQKKSRYYFISEVLIQERFFIIKLRKITYFLLQFILKTINRLSYVLNIKSILLDLLYYYLV